MESYKLLLEEEKPDNYKKYMLDQDNFISLENVYKVNAMIQLNSSYNQSANINACPIIKKNMTIDDNMINGNYYTIEGNNISILKSDDDNYKYLGSSAFWFSKLKEFIDDTKKETVKIILKNANGQYDVSFSYVLYKTICCVDNENSTHLNSDKVGRAFVAKRLFGIKDQMKAMLQNSNYKIIDYISENEEKIKLNLIDGKQAKYKEPKYYVSFASKWCHNACYYMLDDKYKDNFAKVDSVVKKAIKKQYSGFIDKKSEKTFTYKKDENDIGIEKPLRFLFTGNDANQKIGKNYAAYIEVIDIIRGNIISRNGLDQLLWYSNKGFDNDDN